MTCYLGFDIGGTKCAVSLGNIENENIIRDLMAMDRLSTNKMGALPEFLKIHSLA